NRGFKNLAPSFRPLDAGGDGWGQPSLPGRDTSPTCPRPNRAQLSGGFTAGDIAARCPYHSN
ncbi:MAG: hypothetical protein WBN22_12705, partial [Verrucomicrobiia bacterium]